MKAEDNILNRFGVFSIRDQERRVNKNVTKENWKSFVYFERAIKVAKLIK